MREPENYKLRVDDTGHPGTWIVDRNQGKSIWDIHHYSLNDKDARLEVGLVDEYNRIVLSEDFGEIEFTSLTSKQKNAFRRYLRERMQLGKNIGYRWAFFRSRHQKQHVMVYGPNVVGEDLEFGSKQIQKFLAASFEDEKRKRTQTRILLILAIMVIAASPFLLWKIFEGKPGVVSQLPGVQLLESQSDAMKFYQKVFPDVYQWSTGPDPKLKEIAQDILKPEYVQDLLQHTRQAFWSEPGAKASAESRAVRLILLDFFNYNQEVRSKWSKYHDTLEGTTFGDWYHRFSFSDSSLSHYVLYYKVGDLQIPSLDDIDKYLADHFVDSGYRKIKEADVFKGLPIQEEIKTRLKALLDQGLYLHTPLRVANPQPGIEWYLLTRTDSNTNRIDFAAFFRGSFSTLVPQDIGNALLQNPGATTGQLKVSKLTWYKIRPEQASRLLLRDSSIGYFRSGSTQTLQTDIIQEKIRDFKLEEASNVQVEVRRELLLGLGNDRYGLQADDPIIWLLLANMIQERSSETSGSTTLKRDVVPVHITSVQLSKAYDFSARVTDVSPGTAPILGVFSAEASFMATFSDGRQAKFVKLDDDLFSPYAFKVIQSTIAFISKDEIDQMTINIGTRKFKVVRDKDNYTIRQID